MQRFYLPPDNFIGDYAISTDLDFIKRLSLVLRAKEGDKFLLFNGDGREKLAQLLNIGKQEVKLLIIDDYSGPREPVRKINLFLALLKADKLEWAVQKSVELGAVSITPIVCKRSVSQSLIANKSSRLKQIIKEATEQCGGSVLAGLQPLLPYKQALLSVAKSAGRNLIAWEDEDNNRLADFASDQINLFIGPEGGFAKEEIEIALNLNFTAVSLGQRILRAETAPIAALSILLLT